MGGGLCTVFCGIGGMLGRLPGRTCGSFVPRSPFLFQVLRNLVQGVLALLGYGWFGWGILVFAGAVVGLAGYFG